MQVEQLLALQKLDIEISNLQKDAQFYPNQVGEARDKETKARTVFENLKTKLEQSEREHLDMSTTFELEDQRLKKSKTKVKQLKTSYEFQALNREIQNTERSNKELEESMIKKLEEIETLKKQLAEKEVVLNTLTDELQKIETEANVKTGEFHGVLETKLTEQKKIKDGLDRAVLSKYVFIQRKYQDVVVALIGTSCQGCFRNLPPQLANEILRDKKLVSCPNCSRLLYVR